jgi:hypothetical protein
MAVVVLSFASLAQADNCVVTPSKWSNLSLPEWDDVGRANPFFLSPFMWKEIVQGPTRKPVVYYNLALQYAYATLNFQHGAVAPVEVVVAYGEATDVLSVYAPTFDFKSNAVVSQEFLSATSVLKTFNQGKFGVPRCK